MDKVISKAYEIRDELTNLPLIQEYLSLKKLIENDEELKKMREDIARLTALNKKEEKENLLNVYKSHPLVNNYETTKEEVRRLFNEMSYIIKSGK